MSMLRRVSKFNYSFDNNFLRKFKKIYKKDKLLYNKIREFIILFSENPFYPSFRTHRVTVSNYGRVYASRVTGDIRIIWNLEEDLTLLLLDLGGHEGSKKVYR